MLTIQQVIRAVRDLQARVAKLEEAAKPVAVEIPKEMEPVVRRGRPRKTDVMDQPAEQTGEI